MSFSSLAIVLLIDASPDGTALSYTCIFKKWDDSGHRVCVTQWTAIARAPKDWVIAQFLGPAVGLALRVDRLESERSCVNWLKVNAPDWHGRKR